MGSVMPVRLSDMHLQKLDALVAHCRAQRLASNRNEMLRVAIEQLTPVQAAAGLRASLEEWLKVRSEASGGTP